MFETFNFDYEYLITDYLEIASLMSKYVNIIVSPGGAGADVSPLTDAGVPGVGLKVAADGEGLFSF